MQELKTPPDGLLPSLSTPLPQVAPPPSSFQSGWPGWLSRRQGWLFSALQIGQPAPPLANLMQSLLIAAAYVTDFEYCNKNAEYPVKVKGVEISPHPIARGEPATFSISATAGDTITKGKLVIDVEYWIFHVHEETHDLCTKTSCPVSTGDFVIAHEQTLPSFAPPGSYTLTMKMLGEDGKQLTCVTFGFNIGFIAPVLSVADI